jgi:type IX secretion system PorP/SprF family membrane protein
MAGKKKFLLLLLLSAALTARAQMDVQFSDYTRLRSYFNPAVSGTDGKLNVAAAYSMQFVGYENAPATMYVGADLPIYFLGPRHGVGINLVSDKAGIFTTQKIGLQYAYNLKLGKKSRLAIGAQAAFLSEKIGGSNIKLQQENDPAFPTSEVNGSKIDFAAGLYFYHPNYWVGASAQHLAAPLVELGEKNEFQFERIYYLMGGCNIRFKNTFLSLQPSFLVMSDFRSWREDVQCRLAYEYEVRAFYAGVGYSPSISTTFLVGGNFHGISLGYSYQMYTSGIGLVNGSHEITLGYQVDLNLFKKGRNKHKSVRFL